MKKIFVDDKQSKTTMPQLHTLVAMT